MSAAPDVIQAVSSLLRGRPRSHALTGERLALEVSARLGRPVHARRCGEAVEVLTARGQAICSLSGVGYWEATAADEYEASVAESRRRALSTLRAHRAKRRNLLRLRGQTTMGEVA